MFKNLIPDVTLHMRQRDDTIQAPNPYKWVINKTSDLFAGKRIALFGLPGAFTPTCSTQQLPKYEELYYQLIDAGIDEVYCTSVNDAFVMHKWAQDLGIKNVKMLPDGNGDLAQALGMLVDKSNLGFGKRSWRYSMIIDDLEIIDTFAEDQFPGDLYPIDPFEVSDAQSMLDYILYDKFPGITE